MDGGEYQEVGDGALAQAVNPSPVKTFRIEPTVSVKNAFSLGSIDFTAKGLMSANYELNLGRTGASIGYSRGGTHYVPAPDDDRLGLSFGVGLEVGKSLEMNYRFNAKPGQTGHYGAVELRIAF